MKSNSNICLKYLANKIRDNTLDMVNSGNSSHVASVFSMAELIACLYGKLLNISPDNVADKNRDRFILSKGHAGAGIYAVLAEMGFIDKELLLTHYQNGSKLSGHVSHKNIPGVEFSTGSLGHGLPVAAGMAYAAKLDKRVNKVVVLISDGECDEGSNWEAILFSAHNKLNNLIVIVDYNKMQSLDYTNNTINLEPFKEKWISFGWSAYEVDGHNTDKIVDTYYKANIEANINKKPICIIAHTVKGKGVSFMEEKILWHYRSPQGEEYKKAKEEIKNTLKS